jgi:hypothetical protein
MHEITRVMLHACVRVCDYLLLVSRRRAAAAALTTCRRRVGGLWVCLGVDLHPSMSHM